MALYETLALYKSARLVLPLVLFGAKLLTKMGKGNDLSPAEGDVPDAVLELFHALSGRLLDDKIDGHFDRLPPVELDRANHHLTRFTGLVVQTVTESALTHDELALQSETLRTGLEQIPEAWVSFVEAGHPDVRPLAHQDFVQQLTAVLQGHGNVEVISEPVLTAFFALWLKGHVGSALVDEGYAITLAKVIGPLIGDTLAASLPTDHPAAVEAFRKTLLRYHAETHAYLKDIQEIAARTEGKVDAMAAQIQKALAILQQRHNPETDPIHQWPTERLEEEVALQMNVQVSDLRALLSEGHTSLLLQLQKLDSRSIELSRSMGQMKGALGENLPVIRKTVAETNRGMKTISRWWPWAAFAFLLFCIGIGWGLYHLITQNRSIGLRLAEMQGQSIVIQKEASLGKVLTNGQLETELARRMKLSVADLRALLALGRSSQKELTSGQALLISGEIEKADEKFDSVIAKKQSDLQELRQAFQGKAQIAWATGSLGEALDYAQKAATLVDKSADPIAWCKAQELVATLHYQLRSYKEAEVLLREVITLRKNHQSDYPDITPVLNQLATLLQETNHPLEEVQTLFEMALEIDRKSFGENDPEVGRDLNNLALVLQQRNQLPEARVKFVQALNINLKNYGPINGNVANNCNNLAQLLRSTNQLKEAEALYRVALEINSLYFGQGSPSEAIFLNNLALLLQETNRLAEAEKRFKQALKINQSSLGLNHPAVAVNLNNLAQLLRDTNRLREAEPLYRQALRINETNFGSEHPAVATNLNNLAQLLQETNRLYEAESLFRRALKINETSYGPEHPAVAINLNNLGLLLQAMNRPAEAEPLFQRALKINQSSFGLNHPAVATNLNNLGSLLQDIRRLSEAEPLFEQAQKINETSYGRNHPAVATNLNNLGLLFQDMKRPAEAEPLFQRALKINETSYGPNHPAVATNLDNLAQLLQAMDRPAEAGPLFQRALKIYAAFKRSTGHQHRQSLRTEENYRKLLKEMGLSGEEISERIRQVVE